MASSVTTPKINAWDASGNPIAPSVPAATSAPTAWDEKGNPIQNTTAATAPLPAETAADRIASPKGTTTGTISAAPTGAKAWLNDAENDVLHGGQNTFIGKLLHAAGANPNGAEAGVSPAVAQNMASVPLGVIHTAQGIADMPDHPVTGGLHALGGALQTATLPLSFIAPETQALKDASVASQVRQALLPTTQEVGKGFAPIEAAAKSTPINTDAARAIADEANKYAQTGAQMPKVLRNFLDRTAGKSPMDPQSPVFYPEGRKFAENAGKLSVSETMDTKPQMQRLVGKFADALKTANRDAAAEVGMGDQYDEVMKAYRGAAGRENMLEKLKDLATSEVVKHVATGAGIGGAGYAAYKTFGK